MVFNLQQDRRPRFWDWSASGSRLISRPIVVDGLAKPYLKIEIAPRIRQLDGRLVDESFEAVEHMANQLIRSFTLPQLVMATVALQIHMRRTRSFIEKKRELQERWTLLARKMRRLRAEDGHLTYAERDLDEKKRELVEASHGARQALALKEREELLQTEEKEIRERRQRWKQEESETKAAWSELEKEDEDLMRDAPFHGQEDLRRPYILTIVSGAQGGRRRTLSSAMNTLVEALQKPLSRTDQALLEIALRRCVRDQAPFAERNSPESWEREQLLKAETEFLEEFPWATPYRSPLTMDEHRAGRGGAGL